MYYTAVMVLALSIPGCAIGVSRDVPYGPDAYSHNCVGSFCDKLFDREFAQFKGLQSMPLQRHDMGECMIRF